MVIQDVNAHNIKSIINDVRAAIENAISKYSFLSIAQRALEELCKSHFYQLSLNSGTSLLRMDEIDVMNKNFLLPSIILTPHYLICFSLARSASDNAIPDEEYNKLRNHVKLWLYLTEIFHSGFLYYYGFLKFNDATFDLEGRFDGPRLNYATSKYKQFFGDYVDYQTLRGECSLRQIFSFALEDIAQVDELILEEVGFKPSVVLNGLYCLFEEWEEIYEEYPLSPEIDGYQGRQLCSALIDFEFEHCQRILKKKGIADIHEAFDRITLTAGKAKEYVQSRECKKKPQDKQMLSYPLWDYPLLSINQEYISHPALLVECFQELALRLISISDKALSEYISARHEDLVKRVCSILREIGFTNIRPNVLYKVNGLDFAQFDILADRSKNLWHFECKTVRFPWRMHMYHNPMEIEKEARDFLRANRLSVENWNKKLDGLDEYVSKVLKSDPSLTNSIVVTDAPTPASNIFNHVEIVWIKRLESYLERFRNHSSQHC